MKTAFWLLVVFGAAAMLGVLARFEFTAPEKTCVMCHEIRSAKESWLHGAHKDVNCKACHGRTLDAPLDNLRRAWVHVTRKTNEPRILNEIQVQRMTAACAKCHRAEAAGWAKSHGGTAEKFLTNVVHNTAWKPADNCLRCHGMFLDGGDISEILTADVEPQGPKWKNWRFRDAARGKHAAVPCLACHDGHGTGIAWYSRPERTWFKPDELYAQRVKGGEVSADARSRVCQNCHAANAEGDLHSGDDKTPTGVHKGLSCLACHRDHDLDAEKSCGSCHAKCVKGKMKIHGNGN